MSKGRNNDRQRAAIARLPWNRIRMNAIEPEDAPAFHVWQNDPELRDLILGFRFPIPRPRVDDWIAGLSPQGRSPDRAIFAGSTLRNWIRRTPSDASKHWQICRRAWRASFVPMAALHKADSRREDS